MPVTNAIPAGIGRVGVTACRPLSTKLACCAKVLVVAGDEEIVAGRLAAGVLCACAPGAFAMKLTPLRTGGLP